MVTPVSENEPRAVVDSYSVLSELILFAVAYLAFVVMHSLAGIQFGLSMFLGYLLGVGSKHFCNSNKFAVLGLPGYLCQVGVDFLGLVFTLVLVNSLVASLMVPPEIASLLALSTTIVGLAITEKIVFPSSRVTVFFEKVWNLVQIDRRYLKYFWSGLGLKSALILITGSWNMSELFVPFLHKFVQAPMSNPYDYFASLGRLDIFPYSSAMLWLFSIPTSFATLIGFEPTGQATFVANMLAKIPALLADIICLTGLMLALPARKKEILKFYWLNPVILFACYFHGQLDLIPTSIFLCSAIAIYFHQNLIAYLLLGVAFATKGHVLAALPVFLIVTYHRTHSLWQVLRNASVSSGIYFLLQLPYLSEGYKTLVLKEERHLGLVEAAFEFEKLGGVTAYLAPAVLLFITLKFLSEKTADRDHFFVYFRLFVWSFSSFS